jgi:hypothetical protein
LISDQSIHSKDFSSGQTGVHCDFVNPLQDPQWNEKILEREDATFFHSAEWARVLVEAYGYEPQYAVFSDAGRTVGILPIMEVRSLWTGNRGISLPFSDECPPLLASGVTLPGLVEPLRAHGMERGWSYLEFRGGGEMLPAAAVCNEFAFHHLGLDEDEDGQFRRMREANRRNIRKGIREGVQVERLYTRGAMDVFYRLHCETRRLHGLPPQPAGFFHLIHKHVIEKGHGFVSLARHEQRWIAGAVFFEFGESAMYKFGASDKHFQHLRANNLVMWDAICYFQRKQFRELSLGRSRLNNEGLMRFKRSWGAEETSVKYHQIGLQKKVKVPYYERSETAAWLPKVTQWIPLPVLRLIGRLAYRHIA